MNSEPKNEQQNPDGTWSPAIPMEMFTVQGWLRKVWTEALTRHLAVNNTTGDETQVRAFRNKYNEIILAKNGRIQELEKQLESWHKGAGPELLRKQIVELTAEVERLNGVLQCFNGLQVRIYTHLQNGQIYCSPKTALEIRRAVVKKEKGHDPMP